MNSARHPRDFAVREYPFAPGDTPNCQGQLDRVPQPFAIAVVTRHEGAWRAGACWPTPAEALLGLTQHMVANALGVTAGQLSVPQLGLIAGHVEALLLALALDHSFVAQPEPEA